MANYLMSIMARGVYDRRGFYSGCCPTLALLKKRFFVFLEGWSFFFFFWVGGGGGGGVVEDFWALACACFFLECHISEVF